MTQVWPGLGEAPVPSLMSSNWRPLGVFCILDSPFCAASGAGVGLTSSARAGATTRAAASAVAENRERFIIVFSPFWPSDRAAGVYRNERHGRRRAEPCFIVPRRRLRSLFVRTGLAALGLLYVAMGVVSARVAFLGASERGQGVPGALSLLMAQTYQTWLLGAVA